MAEKREVWLRQLVVCLGLAFVGICAWTGSLHAGKHTTLESRGFLLVLALLLLSFACGIQILVSTVILAVQSLRSSGRPGLLTAHGVATLIILVLLVLAPYLVTAR